MAATPSSAGYGIGALGLGIAAYFSGSVIAAFWFVAVAMLLSGRGGVAVRRGDASEIESGIKHNLCCGSRLNNPSGRG